MRFYLYTWSIMDRDAGPTGLDIDWTCAHFIIMTGGEESQNGPFSN